MRRSETRSRRRGPRRPPCTQHDDQRRHGSPRIEADFQVGCCTKPGTSVVTRKYAMSSQPDRPCPGSVPASAACRSPCRGEDVEPVHLLPRGTVLEHRRESPAICQLRIGSHSAVAPDPEAWQDRWSSTRCSRTVPREGGAQLHILSSAWGAHAAEAGTDPDMADQAARDIAYSW